MASTTASATVPAKDTSVSVQAFLKSLSDEGFVSSATTELDTQIAAQLAKLERMQAARALLSGPPAASQAAASAPPVEQKNGKSRKPAAAASNGKASEGKSKRGRRPGPSVDHGGAITTTLKTKKAGYTLSELHEAVVASGHPIEKKTLATYLNNMIKKEAVVQDGERGSYKYKLVGQSSKS